jgi:ribonuclease Z
MSLIRNIILKLTFLGCYATSYVYQSTSQILEIKRLFLIDCGEGTQVQLRKIKSDFLKSTIFFISHLHGDHFGLIGLVSTFTLLNRIQIYISMVQRELKKL